MSDAYSPVGAVRKMRSPARMTMVSVLPLRWLVSFRASTYRPDGMLSSTNSPSSAVSTSTVSAVAG